MQCSAFNRSMRGLTILLLAAAFLWAPLAGEIAHAHEGADHTSAASAASAGEMVVSAAQSRGGDGPISELHHCGGCHLHLLKGDLGAALCAYPLMSARLPHAGARLAARVLAGPYKPPRLSISVPA